MAENSGKKLAYSVTLWDSATFKHKTFYPGDTLPEWAEGLVKNPRAFVADGDAHASQLVPGRDVPVAGPSQLAHDTDARFADQPRYTHSGSAVNPGYNIAEEPVTVIYAGPPVLHDQVAAHAKDAKFTSDGREQTYKVRTGLVKTEGEANAEAARARDESDANRADAIFQQQQREAEAARVAEANQQLATAQAMQMQLHNTLNASAQTDFDAAMTAEADAYAKQESGAGYVDNPVVQGTGDGKVKPQIGIDDAKE